MWFSSNLHLFDTFKMDPDTETQRRRHHFYKSVINCKSKSVKKTQLYLSKLFVPPHPTYTKHPGELLTGLWPRQEVISLKWKYLQPSRKSVFFYNKGNYKQSFNITPSVTPNLLWPQFCMKLIQNTFLEKNYKLVFLCCHVWLFCLLKEGTSKRNETIDSYWFCRQKKLLI